MSNQYPVPHPADIYAGQQLRLQRVIHGLSQLELGQKVGLTFQQIQKYEKGRNRMALSTLHEIATALNVSPTQFFAIPEAPIGEAINGITLEEITSLVKAFCRISTRQERAKVKRMLAAYAA